MSNLLLGHVADKVTVVSIESGSVVVCVGELDEAIVEQIELDVLLGAKQVQSTGSQSWRRLASVGVLCEEGGLGLVGGRDVHASIARISSSTQLSGRDNRDIPLDWLGAAEVLVKKDAHATAMGRSAEKRGATTMMDVGRFGESVNVKDEIRVKNVQLRLYLYALRSASSLDSRTARRTVICKVAVRRLVTPD